MLRLFSGRRLLVVTMLAVAAVAFAAPAFAQGTLRGKVVDQKDKAVDKANIKIEYLDGINFKAEIKTNNKGNYTQVGLRPGNYRVTASTPELGEQEFTVKVPLGDAKEVNFKLGGAVAAAAAAATAKNDALKKLFDEGVAASTAGQYDDAIAKFNEAAAAVPGCFDCFYNIGHAYVQKKEPEKAVEAYNKAIEMRATYAEAYQGLATAYNMLKQFDKAGEANQKASELAAGPAGVAGAAVSVDTEYNSGVIDWNAGKAADAQVHFEKVIQLKADHAEAYYLLGMSLVSQGKMTEAVAPLEKYLQLAPQGPNAGTAGAVLKQIKK